MSLLQGALQPRSNEQTLENSSRLVYGEDYIQHDSTIMFDDLFSLSGLSLDRLKAFADIVAAGGITAAAQNDSNKQSQLSRQLKELERFFRTELIKRGHGPMNLTPSGRRLRTVIAHAFGSLDEFRRECRDEPIELSIGAGEGIIQWLLLPRLSDFLTNHPGITVSFQNLRNDDIRRAVADGSLDFGVLSRARPERSLAIMPLGPLEYRLFVPKTLAKTAPRRGAELIGELPLGMLRSSDTIRMALNEAAEKHGFKLNVRVLLSSYPQLAAAVQQLQLAAVMPAIAGGALPASETLRIRLPLLDALQRQLSLVWSRKAAEVRPAIATYSKVLSQAFRISGGGLTQQREPPLSRCPK